MNSSQQQAVSFSPDRSLQILAGPGSGKTHVLTSRVAHLLNSGIEPWHIIAVTFTKKAANELKTRLHRAAGIRGERVNAGTFHSIACRLLRKYGSRIGLKREFSIMDTSATMDMLRQVMSMDTHNADFSASQCRTWISNLKSHNIDAHAAAQLSPEDRTRILHSEADAESQDLSDATMDALVNIYSMYESNLVRSSSLDFDDLISYGLRLVTEHPEVVRNIRHVLVDEFQDTSHLQYALARQLASRCNALTVVGDPDQSIYGWRNADYGNFARMDTDLHPEHVFLDTNYRSVGTLVGVSAAMLRGVPHAAYNASNIAKPSLPTGMALPCHGTPTQPLEAAAIVDEIRIVMAQFPKNTVSYSDFAVLFRFNSMAAPIEKQLIAHNIPYRRLGGQSLFDSKDAKDILAFANLAFNVHNGAAFIRALTMKKGQGIGPQKIESLIAHASEHACSLYDAAHFIVSHSKWPTAAAKSLSSFLDALQKLHTKAQCDSSVHNLLVFILDLTALRKEAASGEASARLEAIDHFVKAAADFDKHWADSHQQTDSHQQNRANDANREVTHVASADSDESPFVDAEDPLFLEADEHESPLEQFLTTATLDANRTQDDPDAPMVTLSTVHAAKGLEWPFVFLAGCDDMVYPNVRGTHVSHPEDARVLYVALTRAKVACFVSYNVERGLSRFLRHCRTKCESLFSDWNTGFTDAWRTETLAILNPLNKEASLTQDTVDTVLSKMHFDYFTNLQLGTRMHRTPSADNRFGSSRLGPAGPSTLRKPFNLGFVRPSANTSPSTRTATPGQQNPTQQDSSTTPNARAPSLRMSRLELKSTLSRTPFSSVNKPYKRPRFIHESQ